jgi:excisionase family DNA binding protein
MIPVPVHYLSPREVGELLGVSGDTIRRMIKARQLRAVRMPPGNYYKVAPAEVLRYVGAHQLPLSKANRQLLETMIAEGNGGGPQV